MTTTTTTTTNADGISSPPHILLLQQVVAGQVAVSIPLQGPEYRLTREALESSYNDATTTRGLNVRGLIITNPHNPLGMVLVVVVVVVVAVVVVVVVVVVEDVDQACLMVEYST